VFPKGLLHEFFPKLDFQIFFNEKFLNEEIYIFTKGIIDCTAKYLFNFPYKDFVHFCNKFRRRKERFQKYFEI